MHNFEWLRSRAMTDAQRAVAFAQIPKHYVALMHTDVLVGPDCEEGVTSVTSIDIHDIARSSCTYGIEKFFIVTPCSHPLGPKTDCGGEWNYNSPVRKPTQLVKKRLPFF